MITLDGDSPLQQLAQKVLQERKSIEVCQGLISAFHTEYAGAVAPSVQQLRENQRRAYEESRRVCVL